MALECPQWLRVMIENYRRGAGRSGGAQRKRRLRLCQLLLRVVDLTSGVDIPAHGFTK
jgi:hypothetical protein